MMKVYPSWFVFITVNLIGVMLILSSDNWFSVWLGFELSLLTFLPLFVGSSLMVEALVKYFLVQAGGSSVFALSFLLPIGEVSDSLLVFSMCLKLGVFPFYHWVPLVMVNLTWWGCLILATVQKVGPLFVLCNHGPFCFSLLLFFGVVSVLVGGLLGFNQVYMRPLMAYSSISHTGWLIISLLYSFSLFLAYLFVYYLLVGLLFGMFSYLKVNKVVMSMSGSVYLGFANLLVLVLSGLPPFSLFYLKASIIYYLSNVYYFVPFVLLGSVLSIYYYLNFVIPSLSGLWKEGFVFVERGLVVLIVLFSFCLPFVFLI